MGTIHQVPKKLEPGMKVLVCWHREWIPFTWYQVSKGYKHKEWFKGTLLSVGKYKSKESYVIRIKGDEHCLYAGDVIIIRSVALKDNISMHHEAAKQRARLKYREKKVAEQLDKTAKARGL